MISRPLVALGARRCPWLDMSWSRYWRGQHRGERVQRRSKTPTVSRVLNFLGLVLAFLGGIEKTGGYAWNP